MGEALSATAAATRAFLERKYGAPVDGVVPIGVGAWSRAFAFSVGDARRVIRWSDVADNFARDAFAVRFRGPGLPVPPILEIGRVGDQFFAIAPFVAGAYLESLAGEALVATVPAVLELFRALRSADLAGTTGFGFFDGSGHGSYPSWRAFLLNDKNEAPGSVINGWRARLEGSALGMGAYEALRARFEPLVARCPEVRGLVHADLLHFNVLCQSGRISAVLDWGSAFYGDPLYDIVWFRYYQPWYPEFARITLAERLLAGFRADPRANTADIDARVRCYELHIGLDSIAYNAFKQDWPHAEEAAAYTLALEARGR
ncbi:MAG TPA: phosphotransferase [Thermomicrobiaceae bacterium]|nr:phosphotransferase [Thermomicrobiaceae bacterium]